MQRGNLFDGAIPDRGERFAAVATIAARGGARIECIVSSDTPEPQIYAQDHDEWVVVLEGRAELEVDGVLHVLDRGDWITLPAGVPHRVCATTMGTRWLAVHGDG